MALYKISKTIEFVEFVDAESSEDAASAVNLDLRDMLEQFLQVNFGITANVSIDWDKVSELPSMKIEAVDTTKDINSVLQGSDYTADSYIWGTGAAFVKIGEYF